MKKAFLTVTLVAWTIGLMLGLMGAAFGAPSLAIEIAELWDDLETLQGEQNDLTYKLKHERQTLKKTSANYEKRISELENDLRTANTRLRDRIDVFERWSTSYE